MVRFVGGSATAMVRQIKEGFTLVNVVMLKRYGVRELEALIFEIEKNLRGLRGEAVNLDDIVAIQEKARRVTRLENAVRVVRGSLQKFRRRI